RKRRQVAGAIALDREQIPDGRLVFGNAVKVAHGLALWSAQLAKTRAAGLRRHQCRWPKMLCAISRPIPHPNPCTTDRMRPAPCSGAKTAIAPAARPARMKSLMKALLEIEAAGTGRRGRRERAARRRNSSVALSRAGAAARSPRRPR